jgi:hypothetical protein
MNEDSGYTLYGISKADMIIANRTRLVQGKTVAHLE